MASVARIGVADGLLVALGLAWTFGLGYGSNLALTAILRGPQAAWKSLMPAVFCFLPIFLGVIPVGSWLSMSRFPNGQLPSAVFCLPAALSLWGLLAPGGFLKDGLKKIRAGLNQRP